MRTDDRPVPSVATATDGGVRRSASRNQRSAPPRTPVRVAHVVTALIALAMLAAVPWTANSRLARVRLDSTETIAPARQYVRDIEGSMALEAAIRNRAVTTGAPELTRRYHEAKVLELSCDSALGALAPLLGDSLAGAIATLRSLTAQWRADRDGDEGADGTHLVAALAAAARVDSALAERQASQGARIRSLEALNVLLPSVLVPLLAVVLMAMFWTGRRMATLASEAEQSRLALAIASEHRVSLLRGLTHDLKNALGAAGGFAALLREEVAGPLTAQQRDHVARIGRILEHTMIAVEDALMIARTEAGALPVRRRQLDLSAILLESASDYVVAAERAGLTLTVDVAEDLPSVETDSALVSKIIGNLLSNAIKYTPSGGRIWLRATIRPRRDGQHAGPWVVAEVGDTGPGVPAAFREQVFDEFFRAPAATIIARGEGIGLAVSRRVARLLGGEITLESDEGLGAAFTLWLPMHTSDAVSPELSPPLGGRPSRADEERDAAENLGGTAEGRVGAPPTRLTSAVYDRRRANQ